MRNPNQSPLNRPFLDDDLYPALATCVQGKFRGHRPQKHNKGSFDTYGCRLVSDTGWHRGQVTLNGRVVYTGKALRGSAAAMKQAVSVMTRMKARLAKEALNRG